MDIQKLLDTLKKGVEFAEQLSPVLQMIPVVGPLADTALRASGTIMEVVGNVQERVAQGAIVLASDDQAQLTELISRIEKVNDELMAYVDNS